MCSELEDEFHEKGSGLGLYVCVGLLKKYLGSLEVTSEEGKGSSFYIKISQI